MGFRQGAFCTVWSIEPATETRTKGRISISRKNKQTGEYETDFSGFVDFIGTAAANKALGLKEKDRIKLGDVDVTNVYNKEKNVTYTNCKIFSFEMANGSQTQSSNPSYSDMMSIATAGIDDGEIDDSTLPF